MLSGRVNRAQASTGNSESTQHRFKASGFTLLPSLASSRPPDSIPNSSLSQGRNLDHPLIFDDNYRLVTSWYNEHRNVSPTTIRRLQLRKEHRSPAHESILVLTQGNYAYRIDRSRGGPVLDTVTEQGVPPHDTITPLRLASTDELDETSYCMVELCWGNEKTVDLLLVLNICFQIHYESGKRYKLLTHNCYFFSQTIIMIVIRKIVVCRARLDQALKRGICEGTWKLCLEAASKSANSNLMLEPGKLLGTTLETELGSELGSLGSELGLALGWALKGELERDLKEALKDLKVAAGDPKGDLNRNLRKDQEQTAWEGRSGMPLARRGPLGWMLGWMLGLVRKQERAQQRAQQTQRNQELQQTQREQTRQREQERQREQWFRSQQREQWQQQWLRQRLQQLQMEWENIPERELALVLARRVLGDVLELVLSGELELNWPKERANPKTLAKTIPDKFVCMWYVKPQTSYVVSDMFL